MKKVFRLFMFACLTIFLLGACSEKTSPVKQVTSSKLEPVEILEAMEKEHEVIDRVEVILQSFISQQTIRGICTQRIKMINNIMLKRSFQFKREGVMINRWPHYT